MTTKAIILKKQNTNEYDQLVSCYTRDFGKLTTIAKSILKPRSIQALHLDVFNLVEFELINGKGMPIVTGAQLINSYIGLKNSFAKTAAAYFFIEAVDKMVFENDKDERLWDFLVSFLGGLNKLSTTPSDGVVKLLRQGQLELLDVLGYLPEVSFCKVCNGSIGKESSGAFNYNLGGVICNQCFLSGYSGILVGREELDLIQNKSTESINTRSFRRSVLDGMFEYISGSKFYSLELINMLKYQ
ncbi:MAG: DNA repair protein RecO [Candidatus Colwellbacteria bacterium]|nr:DNA repair protein RecO [Candidatus Colwellbacteria bacterium]